MKKLMVLVLLLPIYSAFSQQLTFEIIYGGDGYDEARSICKTTDGGYLVSGISGSYPSGNSDVFLLKLDSVGAIEWFKFPGGSNLQGGYAVQQTSDGGYIVSGLTDAGDFGGYDVYLMKTDGNGDSLWTKTFGGADWDFGYYVEETSDNGLIIGGTTYSFGKGEQMYMIKTDANGNVAWTKTHGGAGLENAKCIRQCADGGYILAGYSSSYSAGLKDIYILKTDAAGDSVWSKTYGTLNNDEGTFVDLTTDGGYIICGYAENYQFGKAFAVVSKLSASGSEDWVQYIGSNNADEFPYVIRQSADGGYVYAGYTTGIGAGAKDFRLVKVNSGGWFQWGRTAGGADNDIAYSMQTTTDGGFILAGITESYGNDPVNAIVLKTDTIGGYYNPVTIGVDEIITSEHFQVFPNPASTMFNIAIPEELIKHSSDLLLYDASGRLLFKSEVKSLLSTSGLIRFDVNNYENGIYLLKIETSKGSIVKRVIVAK